MDFIPDHPKWYYCGCHLRNVLMMLAGLETVVSLIVLSCSITFFAVSDPEQYNKIRWCMFLLIPVSFIYAISSASLFFGIYKYEEKFMKPTLIARAILAVFSHATAFSIAVQFARVTFNIEPTSELLLGISILLFLITIFALRTLRFIEQSIHYVEAYKRLLRKRTLNISYRIRSSRVTNSIVHSPIIGQTEQEDIVDCTSYQETGCRKSKLFASQMTLQCLHSYID